jgi:hypothetical protein
VVIAGRPKLYCTESAVQCRGDPHTRVLEFLPVSPASASIQTASTVASEFQASSFTLYPHNLSGPSLLPFAISAVGGLNANSPCRKPFLSKNTTSCLPSLPGASPSRSPKRWVLAISVIGPTGRHVRECSSPPTGSAVACSVAVRSYTRSTRRAGCAVAEEEGASAETQKNAPSPRQHMRGRPSSSGLLPASLVIGILAAFPSEPWNCVSFEPQPTLTCASA